MRQLTEPLEADRKPVTAGHGFVPLQLQPTSSPRAGGLVQLVGDGPALAEALKGQIHGMRAWSAVYRGRAATHKH